MTRSAQEDRARESPATSTTKRPGFLLTSELASYLKRTIFFVSVEFPAVNR